MHSQKALVVTDQTVGALNDLLRSGWTVVSATPMGGGGQAAGFASLVVLEKSASAAESLLEQIEEAVEAEPDEAIAQDPLLRRLQDDADDLGPMEN